MDEIAAYNKARWEEIAATRMMYTRPFLDLDPDSARRVVDPQGILGDVAGKEVLCLAAGGGQQSAAFALLGARVTVMDLSETQLAWDQEAAAHYRLPVTTVQGDMRDLSRFADNAFDVVWHAHSINFVPDTRPVFQEVARVLREGGLYRVDVHNPFTHAVDDEAWNGESYPLKHPYVDGAEVSSLFPPHWDVECEDGTVKQIEGPREFRHTLSTLINGLVARGFVLLGAWEETQDIPNPEPGTWQHFKSVAAPYLIFWAAHRPAVLAERLGR